MKTTNVNNRLWAAWQAYHVMVPDSDRNKLDALVNSLGSVSWGESHGEGLLFAFRERCRQLSYAHCSDELAYVLESMNLKNVHVSAQDIAASTAELDMFSEDMGNGVSTDEEDDEIEDIDADIVCMAKHATSIKSGGGEMHIEVYPNQLCNDDEEENEDVLCREATSYPESDQDQDKRSMDDMVLPEFSCDEDRDEEEDATWREIFENQRLRIRTQCSEHDGFYEIGIQLPEAARFLLSATKGSQDSLSSQLSLVTDPSSGTVGVQGIILPDTAEERAALIETANRHLAHLSLTQRGSMDIHALVRRLGNGYYGCIQEFVRLPRDALLQNAYRLSDEGIVNVTIRVPRQAVKPRRKYYTTENAPSKMRYSNRPSGYNEYSRSGLLGRNRRAYRPAGLVGGGFW